MSALGPDAPCRESFCCLRRSGRTHGGPHRSTDARSYCHFGAGTDRNHRSGRAGHDRAAANGPGNPDRCSRRKPWRKAARPGRTLTPRPGKTAFPADVGKFTVAMDSWGTSDLNPWAKTSVSFLHDYYNLRLMMQDPNGVLAPAWALSFEQTLDGLTFQLNPDARFQDGSPADAEALKNNLFGFRGDFVESAGYDAPLWNSAKAQELVADVEVISPTEVFVKTDGGKPTWMWNLGGNGYHLFWYGNANRLLMGPDAYLEDAAGGGPFSIAEWEPNNRILYDRWDDFWADYEHWHKPQFSQMEFLTVSEPAARFALLASGAGGRGV